MTPERWLHIKELFASALEQTPAERQVYLGEACAGNESLRREVERLLSSYEAGQGFMETPAVGEVAHEILKEAPCERRVGRLLGRYRILKSLGSGGMGEVYLAEDTRLGRKVALKLLPEEFTADEGRLRSFEQEAGATSALNHPNILTIHEVGESEGVHFIATEYVEGETLREHMRPGQMKVTEVLDIAAQIAAALAAAHEAGVVHRDIKPENIMLRPDGFVKVLDFGLAKLTEAAGAAAGDTEARAAPGFMTEACVVMGTVAYMSPEQSRAPGRVDHRTDIWSLGVVLYEMVTGRAPFGGEDIHRRIVSIQESDPPPPSRYVEGVPERLEEIVKKALAKDPGERYQQAKELLVDLRHIKRRLEVDSEVELTLAPELRDAGARERVASAADRSAYRRKAAALLVTLFIGTAGAAFFLYKSAAQDPPGLSADSRRTVPFTSFPGQKSSPAFSPDGNRIAFGWDGGGVDNPGIFVKPIDGGIPSRLTANADSEPAWSPDGRYIAFARRGSGGGIFMVPAPGGPERKLTDVAGTLAWSPDGRTLAIAGSGSPQEPFSIFLLTVETGEKRRLTTPAAGSFGDTYPAFSPDGRTIAFIRSPRSLVRDIYLVGAAGGEPRRLTHDNLYLTGNLAWTVDGREVVFSSDRGGLPSLWRVQAPGGQPRRLVGVGEYAMSPSVSQRGGRLAYVYRKRDTNIWRAPGPESPVKGEAPVKLIASTQNEDSPQFSPDDKRIAFSSDRSGSWEIWVSASDGQNPIQLTNFGGSHAGTPRWSPDGKQIAFDSRPEGHSSIYVIAAAGGEPRRVTEGTADEVMPSWSADGRWVYFGSPRGGEWQVWKVRVEGGEAVQVTRNGGVEAFESPDGEYIYYTKHQESGVWRIPAVGGEERRVFEGGYRGNWALTGEGICYLSSEADHQPAIEFFDFATRRVTRLARIEKAKAPAGSPAFAVSSDRRWVLYWQMDQLDNDIMLLENFR